jgi:hypothetical protein
VSRRRASQPELQALTNITLPIALYTISWVTWWAAPGAAVITWYALLLGATQFLRWDTTHTLAGCHHMLRTYLAAAIRATAWALQALTTALLLGLAEAHHRTLPNHPA